MVNSVGLVVFETLCAAGNALETLRDTLYPGSDAWVGLTELLRGLDMLIDRLVESPPLEADTPCPVDAPHA